MYFHLHGSQFTAGRVAENAKEKKKKRNNSFLGYSKKLINVIRENFKGKKKTWQDKSCLLYQRKAGGDRLNITR